MPQGNKKVKVDKITEVGGGVMVQITKGLKDYGRDLGLYSECSERSLEDYILIRLLKDLEVTVPSCKCDFPVLLLTCWPVKDCAPQPSLQGKQLCPSTINCVVLGCRGA